MNDILGTSRMHNKTLYYASFFNHKDVSHTRWVILGGNHRRYGTIRLHER